MRVIVAGSRHLRSNKDDIDAAMSALERLPTEIVSGCAAGPDTAGEYYAMLHDIPCKRFPADWKRHGKAAGPIRNSEMADYADALIAFWDGKSRGTKDMIEKMRNRNKPVHVIQM